MIYFPNKFEIYAASLRLLYQKFIFNHGVTKKYADKLKKIYEFECLTAKDNIAPINLEKYSSQLFTAVILKKKFNYKINIRGNRLLDIKPYTSLLLNICINAEYIKISEICGNIVICGKIVLNKKAVLLIKKLKGDILREIKTDTVYIKLNYPATDKKSADFENAYYMLQNPLSPINLYLPD